MDSILAWAKLLSTKNRKRQPYTATRLAKVMQKARPLAKTKRKIATMARMQSTTTAARKLSLAAIERATNTTNTADSSNCQGWRHAPASLRGFAASIGRLVAQEHGNDTCADHLARRASEQEFAPGHMSIGAHYQKIPALLHRRPQKPLADAEAGMRRHPDVTRLDIVPGEILDCCVGAIMMLIANRYDESFACGGKKRLCSGQGANRLSRAVPAEQHAFANGLRRFGRRQEHGTAGPSQCLLDCVGMDLIDRALRAAEDRQIEKSCTPCNQGRTVAHRFAPVRRRADFSEQRTGHMGCESHAVTLERGNELRAYFGCGSVCVVGEFVDKVARDAFSNGCVETEKIERIGFGVKAFDMGFKATRQATSQLGGPTARGTAAHGRQNGFDAAHDRLLLMQWEQGAR